jgi:hypothetical protein
VAVADSNEADFDGLMSYLTPDNCRYAVIDWSFTTNDGRTTSKIAFISW